MLEAKNIRKSVAAAEILKGISFTLDKGQVLSIIGPSGSGKSTLLRIVTQLEKADGGSLVIDDIPLFSDIPSGCVYNKENMKAAERKTGLVFQNFNLFPHFSVLRNITEAQRAVLKRSREESEAKAFALLKKMGLEDKAGSYPYQLSGGQAQRVSIARALAMDPEILFFDEPTSALDPELTREILSVIRELKEEKMTMVVVTHEMNFAKGISDKVIFMDKGVIVEEGEGDELFTNPRNERTRLFLSNYD